MGGVVFFLLSLSVSVSLSELLELELDSSFMGVARPVGTGRTCF